MNRIISMSLLILSAQALWSCNPPDEYFNQRINLLPTPVALQDYMVLVDTNHEEAIMISASAEDQGESVRIPLPTGPFAAIERPGDYDEILILAAGHSGSRSRLQTPATLSRLDADGGLVSYELGNNPFDTMYVDEAGRYVFLTRKGLNNTLVENPNEIAVVNLVAAPSDPDAVTFITLEGLPLNVFYSKDFQINGTDKNLICVASVSTLFLIDLDHLERYPTVVYLGETEDAEPIIPEQVIFGADAARIYLRAPAASDIYSLKLNSRDTDGDRNDFATSIDIIGVEESPTDMILYTVDNQSFLFVVANHRFGHYIDVATGRTVTVSFAETITRAWYFSRIVDNVTTHHALLWTPNQKAFYVIDFLNIEEMLGRNIRKIGETLDAARELLPVLDGNRLLMLHRYTGLSIIDVDMETISSFVSNQRLNASYLDEERNRFWVAPSGQERVAYVDIESGETNDLLLDADVKSIVPIFKSGKLGILHNSSLGLVSFVDVENPDREHAFSVRGFLIEGVLD